MNIRKLKTIRNLTQVFGITFVGLNITTGSAQAILITPVNNGAGLVNTISWGENIKVIQNSITYTGAPGASGQFIENGSSIGLNKGIVLTSGLAVDGEGPNKLENVTTQHGFPGNADLDTLVAPNATQDAAFLEFEILAEAEGTLNFDYVFASEEYNEFGVSGFDLVFNDVLGVFVDGENVAFVPETTLPVTINNVNGGSPLGTNPVNEQYFNDNDITTADPLLNFAYDGFTDIFTIDQDLTPGTHKVKIAIADTTDDIRDSAIFIQSGDNGGGQVIPEPTSMFGLFGLAYFGFSSYIKRKR